MILVVANVECGSCGCVHGVVVGCMGVTGGVGGAGNPCSIYDSVADTGITGVGVADGDAYGVGV